MDGVEFGEELGFFFVSFWLVDGNIRDNFRSYVYYCRIVRVRIEIGRWRALVIDSKIYGWVGLFFRF